MGDLRRLNVETRSLRSLVGHVPIWQPSAAAGKKKRGEAERDGLPYPQGGWQGAAESA